MNMILIVDDSKVARITLQDYLQSVSRQLVMAEDGVEAWELLEKNPNGYSAVLLDRIMPRMDGMEVLKKIKGHDSLKYLPVIMQTAKNEEHEILEGIRAGAYYYLTKPYSREAVRLITLAAISDFEKHELLSENRQKTISDTSTQVKSQLTFRTMEEAEILSKLLSRKCPHPQKVVVGLWELMINAIEHGNLGISYAEKSELMENGKWEDEVRRRTTLPEYSAKTGMVKFEQTSTEILFHIRDEGNGFDWTPYLEISPERVFDTHGRGIAMSKNKSFDRLKYIGKGNEVLAVVKL